MARRALPGVAVEVDAALDAAADEAAVELVVVAERVGPGADRLRAAEVDAEAGAAALHAGGQARAVEDRLQVPIEGVGGGVDPS